MLSQFQRVGRDLFTRGLAASSTGNLSVRLGDRIVITRRNCELGSLEEDDLVETGLSKNDRATPMASADLAVHRAIYRLTPAQAVVHAHPPHAIALSLAVAEIVPNCAEGLAIVGEVPVLGGDGLDKPADFAAKIAASLREHRAVMLHGHGSYAVGQLLEEAYQGTAMLEESSQVTCLLKSLQVNVAEGRNAAEGQAN